MKRYEAILFDLDGTLLPMEINEFTKGYFSLLSAAVAPYGYEKTHFLIAMQKGIYAMVTNDGDHTNAEAFWDIFAKEFGERVYEDIPKFDAFYQKEFHKARAYTDPQDKSVEAVSLARERAGMVILATNPMFPMVALHARLSWVGLRAEDFDLLTDYDHFHFCKPNPAYFLEIAKQMGVDPKHCLMIGNHTDEDARAAMAAGMDAFLITDCLIAQGELPDCPRGSFEELLSFLKAL